MVSRKNTQVLVKVMLHRVTNTLLEAKSLFSKLLLSFLLWLCCTGPQDMLLEAMVLFCKVLLRNCSSWSYYTGLQDIFFWKFFFSSAGCYSGAAHHGQVAWIIGHARGSTASLLQTAAHLVLIVVGLHRTKGHTLGSPAPLL